MLTAVTSSLIVATTVSVAFRASVGDPGHKSWAELERRNAQHLRGIGRPISSAAAPCRAELAARNRVVVKGSSAHSAAKSDDAKGE